jgi:activator of HSP90 ATPase
METSLVLVINDDIHVDINSFFETIIDVNTVDSHPGAHATIANFNTDFSIFHNLVINKLAVLRNDEEIWNSTYYTKINKLEFSINEYGAQYTVIFMH